MPFYWDWAMLSVSVFFRAVGVASLLQCSYDFFENNYENISIRSSPIFSKGIIPKFQVE